MEGEDYHIQSVLRPLTDFVTVEGPNMHVIISHRPQRRVASIAYFISGIILGHLFHGFKISFHQLLD